MKNLLLSLTVLISINTFACPDISGKYNCPSLDSMNIKFKKSPYADIYSMKIGKESLMFEVGSWNPGINPNTGDIDHSVETMAECKEDKVILNVKQTIVASEVSVDVRASFELTKTLKGVTLSLKTDGVEQATFDCIRK